MSGYGWNSSGYGNPNGFSRAPPTQEHCIVCHQVFYSAEALIKHYETHIREEELMNFLAALRERNFPPNNPLQQQPYFPNLTISSSTSQALAHQNSYMRVQNQAPPQPQRSLAFGPSQYKHLLPPSFLPSTASLSTHTTTQQGRMQPAVPVQRRQNLAALNNGNMMRSEARPMAAVSLAPNQSAAAIWDEIELDRREGENRNTDHDGYINLDLTLGTP